MIYDFIEENSQSTKWLYISAFYHDPVYYQKCYLRILVLQQNHHIETALSFPSRYIIVLA